jgi:uncharacterized protein YbgA (DUF1722 family)/uncharacterized protein YbbK (DUF523 family)
MKKDTSREFPRPVVVVSKCLEFASCRFNGLRISDEFVRALKDFVKFKKVCPEVEIGMGIPRDPIRVVQSGDVPKLMQPASGKDFTTHMNRFGKKYLTGLDDVDGFILKSRSPSCGIKDVKIYAAVDSKQSLGKQAGFFGQSVMDHFPHAAIEDEGRLTNFRIREHFLTKLYTLATFRKVTKSRSMAELVMFQATNKLLFMAYNQKEMRLMGKVVANHERLKFDEVIALYETHLHRSLDTVARYTSHINVLMHAGGYFSKQLSPAERKYFLEAIDDYRDAKIPLSALLSIIKSWIARFGQTYLASQTYFEPYPIGLVEITDSGKGRDL